MYDRLKIAISGGILLLTECLSARVSIYWPQLIGRVANVSIGSSSSE